MGRAAAMTMDSVRARAGRQIAVSEWIAIDQERIDRFAHATDDAQWIHLDIGRAERESPYGATVAHGFLTLSMLSHCSREVLAIEGTRMRVNYGLNRVRFPAAVRAGSFIRARFDLCGVKDFEGGADLTLAVTVDLQGSEKPCCVAEWIVRYYWI
ncbi:MAG: MaoC family dehydratase [Acidobacteriota bacterium]|nr:MaoC family dehydratase [Acidobacteriota bacterium]